MNTKTLLIVFAVLLLLLTLLSAFGGTLKPSENFYQNHPFHELFHEGTFIKPEDGGKSVKSMFGGEGCSSSDPSCMVSKLGHVSDQKKEMFTTEEEELPTINPLSSGNTSNIGMADSIIAYQTVEPFDEISDYSLIV